MYKDYFSQQSNAYRAFRPTYPEPLFSYLSSLCLHHKLAWDVATGNGQAANSLTTYFSQIIATDISRSQLSHTSPHPQIVYWLSDASSEKFYTLEGEARAIDDASVDLVTVAQAYHWLEHDRFHAQVERVLKPGGVFAVWGYGLLKVSSAEIDSLVENFYNVTVGPYWPAERKLLDEGYRTIQFPFRELQAPEFVMEYEWSLKELLGYLGTWSSVQLYIKERREDPVEAFGKVLSPLWGEEKRTIAWPLLMRVGKK